MRAPTKIFMVAGLFALGTIAPVNAQYYPPPPGYGYGYGYHYYAPPPGYGYGYGYHYRTWNGCPPGWTVQGGNCAPYQGPRGPGVPRGARYWLHPQNGATRE